jgi:hypothetical protein
MTFITPTYPPVPPSLQRVCCYCDQGVSSKSACSEQVPVSFNSVNVNVSVNFICTNGPTAFSIPLADNCSGACISLSFYLFLWFGFATTAAHIVGRYPFS